MMYLNLFLSFLKVGIFGIGGGYAAVPIIQSQVVDKFGWITLSEFTDLISIAEMTPGPITINSATFIGIRMAGIPGALCATAGFAVPSLLIVTAVFFFYRKYGKLKASQTVLSFIRPAVVALIAGAGLTILSGIIFGGSGIENINFIALAIFVAAFAVIRIFKASPIAVMLSCGALYTLINIIIK